MRQMRQTRLFRRGFEAEFKYVWNEEGVLFPNPSPEPSLHWHQAERRHAGMGNDPRKGYRNELVQLYACKYVFITANGLHKIFTPSFFEAP